MKNQVTETKSCVKTSCEAATLSEHLIEPRHEKISAFFPPTSSSDPLGAPQAILCLFDDVRWEERSTLPVKSEQEVEKVAPENKAGELELRTQRTSQMLPRNRWREVSWLRPYPPGAGQWCLVTVCQSGIFKVLSHAVYVLEIWISYHICATHNCRQAPTLRKTGAQKCKMSVFCWPLPWPWRMLSALAPGRYMWGVVLCRKGFKHQSRVCPHILVEPATLTCQTNTITLILKTDTYLFFLRKCGWENKTYNEYYDIFSLIFCILCCKIAL